MANEKENYKLNQSGPQVQALLDKIAALPNNEELAALLAEKQNVLIFDETPTEDSTNPVTSAGILAAIQAILSNEYVRVDTYADLGDPSQESMGKLYLVGLENAESFDRYVAGKSGDTYIWVSLGSTELDLSQYYTKEQTDALLEQELQEAIEPLARKDGYYETLTAGMAENLVGQSENTDTFTTETTGGESDFGNGLAELAKIEGNGLAWNQLVQNGDFSDWTQGASLPTGWVGTGAYLSTRASFEQITSGVHISITQDYSGLAELKNGSEVLIGGHKYLIKLEQKGRGFMIGGDDSSAQRKSYDAVAEWTSRADIFSPSTTTDKIALQLYNIAIGEELYLKNIQIIDLSLIYGLGNEPTSVDVVEADLAKLIAQKPYYQENAGELYGVKKLHIVSYGQNLLNPTNAQARLAPYDWDTNSNKYGIAFRNGASASAIQFTPDATGVAESITPDSNGIFTISGAGTLQLTMASGSAASDCYVWAVWDGKKDGIDNYKPYSADALEIAVGNIYGKQVVNGVPSDTMSKVFSDDVMRATGILPSSIRDLVDVQGKVAKVNCGEIDLGDRRWKYETIGDFFEDIDVKYAKWVTPICSHYVGVNLINASSTTPDKAIAMNGGTIGDCVRVKDLSLSASDIDATTKKVAAFAGIKCYYAVYSPLTYTDLKISTDGGTTFQDLPERFSVDNWGVWEQLPNDSTIPSGKDLTGVAAQITTILPMNAPEAIDTFLQQGITTAEERAQVVNILAALKAQNIIGDYSVGETPTDKVFSVSVTPYVEPEPEQEP